MEILAYLTALLLLGLLALITLPVELSLHLEKEETLAYDARLHWLFGLVSVDLSRIARTAAKKRLRKKPKSTKTKSKKRFGGGGSFKQLLWLIRNLLHTLQIRELKFYGRIGLGDPASTGMLMGALQPLLLGAQNMALVADYEKAVFEGRFNARIRVVPIRVLGVFVLFFLSKNRSIR